MNRSHRIFVAGHQGLVGSAIVRVLRERGFDNLVLRTRSELDLTDAGAVNAFFAAERPQYVFLAAARVGGILANTRYPADFVRDNLLVQLSTINAAKEHDVEKLLFLGSSCIYPRMALQPITEDAFLSGPLEPTNEPYAVAKIAGIVMCQSYNRQFGTRFLSVMPTNLYGIHDNFDLDHSHVLPALIRRFHEAKVKELPEVLVWGSGTARREFMHADDFAGAAIHLMMHWGEIDPHGHILGGGEAFNQIINVGYGTDVTIAELAMLIREIVGYEGAIRWDRSKPDGTPRKLLDSTKLRSAGWAPQIALRDGIERTYSWFVDHINEARYSR